MLCFFTNRPCECYHAGGMYSPRRNNVLSQMFCVHVLFPPASVAVLFLLLLSSGYFRHPLSCLWALLVHGRTSNKRLLSALFRWVASRFVLPEVETLCLSFAAWLTLFWAVSVLFFRICPFASHSRAHILGLESSERPQSWLRKIPF